MKAPTADMNAIPNLARQSRPLRESIAEYGRGVAGGLLFSMPLLYTEEMWHTGFLADSPRLLAYVGVSYLLLLGYNRFAGMHPDTRLGEVAVDSIEEMGIGLVVAAVVLFLLGRIDAAMPLAEIVGKIVIASMTVAVGVSVGTAQLGTRGEDDADDEEEADDPSSSDPFSKKRLAGQMALSFCGAVLFASNIGATEEIPRLGMEATPDKLLGLVVLSLAIGAVVLFFSDFRGSGRHARRRGLDGVAFDLAECYGSALVASTMMLWFFGRFEGMSLAPSVAQAAVLAFPSTLGACAGRLLIQR